MRFSKYLLLFLCLCLSAANATRLTLTSAGSGGSSSAVTNACITSISSSGWYANCTNPPTFDPVGDPQYVVASRTGFDTAGLATNYTDNLIITQRVRQPYPNQASLTTSGVALSNYLYSTDTILGGSSPTNSSTETSPKPIAAWVMPHRSVVANSLTVEISVAHRDARSSEQAAAVVVRATDGVTTVTGTQATSTVSNRTGDQFAVIVYSVTLDITSLTDNSLITVNAKVYPWIGGEASILDSADQSALREFSPRYFLKSVTIASGPNYIYVSTAGVDATCITSTIAALAEAQPCLTVLGALNALQTALGGGTGLDGARIRIMDDGGTPFVLGNPASARTQKVACVIVERSPSVARANARVSFGGTTPTPVGFRPRIGSGGSLTAPLTTGCLQFNDLAIVRTFTGTITGEAATRLEIQYNNIDFDNGSNNASWLSNSDDYMYGVAFTNLTGNSALGAGANQHRIMRGLTLDSNFGTMEGWWIFGSSFTRPGTLAATTGLSGAMYAYNFFSNVPANMASIAQSADVTGFAALQNVFEFTSATSNTSSRISADSATGNTTHVVWAHNSYTGFLDNGRSNNFYDEGATARTNKLQACVGNIWDQINTKGDVFVTQSTRVGNWGYLYGVGCRAEFSQFIDANSGGIGTSFAQAYPGLGANIGTSAVTRNDPLFTNYQGTTSGPTAGAGGGTYTITSSSPCKNALTVPVLRFDLAGTARGTTTTSCGAYEAP